MSKHESFVHGSPIRSLIRILTNSRINRITMVSQQTSRKRVLVLTSAGCRARAWPRALPPPAGRPSPRDTAAAGSPAHPPRPRSRRERGPPGRRAAPGSRCARRTRPAGQCSGTTGRPASCPAGKRRRGQVSRLRIVQAFVRNEYKPIV